MPLFSLSELFSIAYSQSLVLNRLFSIAYSQPLVFNGLFSSGLFSMPVFNRLFSTTYPKQLTCQNLAAENPVQLKPCS